MTIIIPQTNREIYYLWYALRFCFHNFIVEILGLAARKLGASVVVMEDYKSLISATRLPDLQLQSLPKGSYVTHADLIVDREPWEIKTSTKGDWIQNIPSLLLMSFPNMWPDCPYPNIYDFQLSRTEWGGL